MNIKFYVLTFEVNAYDQEGEYFICGFKEKPDFHSLKKVIEELYGQDIPFIDEIVGNLIRKGGGRSKRLEYTWFWLREEELK